MKGLRTFREDPFLQMKEILRQNTPRSLESYFDFVFRVLIVFAKNLKTCKIAKFHTRKYTVT